MTISEKNRNRFFTGIFAAFFTAATALFILTAPCGFHFFDEAFYLTVPYSLMQGDALIKDICSPAIGQVLLYPIMLVYSRFFDGTEGIILNFRYIYIFFHALSTLAIYLHLRKHSPAKALCFCALYYLFSPAFIKALAYYGMGLVLVTLCGVIMAKPVRGRCDALFAGLCYALCVVCCPYMVTGYIIYLLAAAVLRLSKRETDCRAFERGALLRFTVACAAAAAVFFAFLFSRAAPSELIGSLPILLGDKNHNPGNIGAKLLDFVPALIRLAGICELLLLALFVLTLADRKRDKRRELYGSVCAILCICAVILNQKNGISGQTIALPVRIMLPVSISGVEYYLLCRRRDRSIFEFLYLPGLLYCLCMYAASDTGITVTGTALVLCASSGAVFTAQFCAELLEEGSARRAVSAAVFCAAILTLFVQTGSELWYRKNYCFSEPCGASGLYCTIDSGVGKGERVSEAVKVYEYDGIMAATEKVRNAAGERVLYFDKNCALYLEDTKKSASYCAWLMLRYAGDEAQRLLDYWAIDPSRKPDAMFVSKEVENARAIADALNTEGFPIEENELGFVMLRG